MLPALSALSVLLVHAASITPATVPATGRQEALLTLDAPSAIHLSARSGSGTSCVVLDRVRGPFANAGVAGGVNCELDLLLDAGQYKVRLESARRGKGAVTLVATPMTELNQTPVRLKAGDAQVTRLKPGQQASFWVSLPARGTPFIHVAGRHAGDVRLWRNGEWLEKTPIAHTQFAGTPGQPQHEWWVDSPLEEGDYQLVVYGRDSTTVTGSSVDDSLTVEYGFRDGPPERSMPFVLGPSGVLTVALPASSEVAAVLSLDSPPASQVTLQTVTSSPRSPQTDCRVEKAALDPECSTWLSARGSPLSVLVVRGPAGTRGQLEWAPWYTDATGTFGGYYSPSANALSFQTRAPGKYLVAVKDLPADTDSAPVGCQLEELTPQGDVAQVLARSAVRIGDGEMLERDFNFPDDGVAIWFEIGSGGSLMQRSGLSSRRFRVGVTGKGTCEVYRLGGKGELKRLTQSKPEATECNELLALDPGFYQLQLPPALSGVRRLTIKEDGATNPVKVTQVGACTLPPQSLNQGRYRMTLSRLGAVRVRELVVEPLPLVNAAVHLSLDSKGSITLPVAATSTSLVRASGGAPFGCTATGGHAAMSGQTCELSAGADTLTLSNPGTTPITVTISHPGAQGPGTTPAPYTPTLKPLPKISIDAPLFFDFERGQSRSAVFEVEAPGLYNVTTQGLLSTSCTLRTQSIDSFAVDTRDGRGRNCLVRTWLQKGRYLLSATATGSSRGRAALSLTRRNVKDFGTVTADGEQFFRVDADELVQQRLAVKTQGTYQLATTAQGNSKLLCRLDDPDGWPLETVPTSCSNARELRAGTWLWTQLPLTVESMRHTALNRVRDEVVLKGKASHPIDAFVWYRAELSPTGKDEFTFSLEGETPLEVTLTNGMQGRIYALEKDRPPRAIELIPPMQTEPASEQEAPPPEDEGAPTTTYGEHEYEREDDPPAPEATSAAAQAQAPVPSAVPTPTGGTTVNLPAGHYKLVAEHSRGDVGVEYRVHLASAVLLPGMTRELPAPSTVPVVIPRDGTLRLRTTGDADVRCRLFDAMGKLVFQGSDNGADWNCALAEPVVKGRYTLVIENETQQRGQTTLSLALPPAEDKGVLTDGAKVTLGASVVTWRIPVAEKDAVQELTLRAQGKTPISCALEDPTGAVVHRQARVSECTLLVRPQLEQWKVRAWTTDGSAAVVAAVKSRPVVDGNPSDAPADKALTVSLPHAGRYKTSAGVRCIGAGERGLLRACGPEVSLEAGPTIFSATGPRAMPLSLDENVSTQDGASNQWLARVPSIQVLSQSKKALFLLEAKVQYGERVAPSCAFDGAGTVRERRDTSCFAASRVGTTATMRVWAASEQELDARVTRTSVTLPETFDTLSAGRRKLTFTSVGRFGLPKIVRARLELTVPSNSWAVLLDEAGNALDLCAPSSELRRCLLTSQGGSVAIISAAGQADVTTVLLEGTPQSVAFNGLYEDSPRQPGTVRLTVAPADSERQVTIEGALRCTVALGDGTRLDSCRAKLPAKSGAELVVDYGVAPVRAMVHVPGREKFARLGLDLPISPGAALTAAIAVPLTSGRIDRTLVVEKESVVRVSSEGGVCGLFRGTDLLAVDGLDTGCELVRVLSPGTYRLLARPFAGRVVPGTLRWTSEPVAQLAEGVGPEEWVAPGDVRLYRFDAANHGKIGLGVQAKSELLECAVYNDGYQLVGEGCHQYLSLDKGRYLLTVRNAPRPGAAPLAFKPVLLGLTGEKNEIPETYLQDFFRRAEVSP
jgi:hypothetical protein